MDQKKDLIVGMPLYNGCTLMDFAGAAQVFASASGFTPIWISNEASITTTENLQVIPDYNFDNHPKVDILFVPGGGDEGVISCMNDKVFLDALVKISKTATWNGSVCTGAFVIAASGILKDCSATTYWSQIPNLKLLAKKMNLVIPRGYPRFLIDEKNHKFTGGGISSSVDLALDLVLKIGGLETAEKTQLSIQYAPGPPINSGDPSEAPKRITMEVTKTQASFIKNMRVAVEDLL